MDYVSTDKDYTAIELKKYQWDDIHDPQILLFAWAEEEEEGEIIDLHLLVKLEKDQFPAQSGEATFFTPAGLPIHFTDISKMEYMYFTTDIVHDCFTQQFKKDDCKNPTTYIVSDKGVLIGFKYDGKLYIPIIEATGNNIPGTIKASDNIFKGYYSDAGYYISDYQPSNKRYLVYWYENGWKEPYEFCFDFNKFINAQYFNKDGYKGAGYYCTFIERSLANNCNELPLKDLDNLDFFNSVLTARYNPWGNGGLLQKIIDRNGKIRLIYSIQEKDLSVNYYEYDYMMEDWIKVTLSGAELSQYMRLDVIKDIAQHFGHGALDIIGFIPAAGEVADA